MEVGFEIDPTPNLPDCVFRRIQDLALSRIGIHLAENKKAMVATRFRKVIQSFGFASYKTYLDFVARDASGKALTEFCNALTTNHTYFNREKAHFEYFRQTALPAIVEDLRRRGERDLRIWCAGCSTGEEAYYLAMLMMEALGLDYPNWQAGVLATDISQTALATAQQGVYRDDNVRRLPETFRTRYLRRLSEEEWEVEPRLKQQVVFRSFNLVSETFPFRKPFHIIFCRNVMIYFQRPTREALVQKFYDQSEPGSYLFLGLSETIPKESIPYESVMPSVYRKPSVGLH